MILNDVHTGIHKRRRPKRVGRGSGSGHGKTAGRGHKGAGSRSGSRTRRGYEGGQMPLFRRVAKAGFNNKAFATPVGEINVGLLDTAFADGDTVTVDNLRAKGLVRRACKIVKVLGGGEISKSLTVEADRFSESAKQKIEAAGGSVRLRT